jgi:hypothetical protein
LQASFQQMLRSLTLVLVRMSALEGGALALSAADAAATVCASTTRPYPVLKSQPTTLTICPGARVPED